MITPDSRSGSMGDVGAATSPDASSISTNPAKYSFIEDDLGFSISYVPWLRALEYQTSIFPILVAIKN